MVRGHSKNPSLWVNSHKVTIATAKSRRQSRYLLEGLRYRYCFQRKSLQRNPSSTLQNLQPREASSLSAKTAKCLISNKSRPKTSSADILRFVSYRIMGLASLPNLPRLAKPSENLGSVVDKSRVGSRAGDLYEEDDDCRILVLTATMSTR